MRQFSDVAFDPVALFVQIRVVRPLPFAIQSRWNHSPSFDRFPDMSDNPVRVAALIGNQRLCLGLAQQFDGGREVSSLVQRSGGSPSAIPVR